MAWYVVKVWLPEQPKQKVQDVPAKVDYQCIDSCQSTSNQSRAPPLR